MMGAHRSAAAREARTASPREARPAVRAAGRLAACVLLVVSAGCAPPEQSELAMNPGDLETYRTEVHPLLEASCATLDCHGHWGRPLRLFAETGLRMADDLRNAPITDDELAANAAALIGVDPSPARPDDHLALRKPLAVTAGGLHHVGRDLWPSTTDAAYVCLRSWLDGTVSVPDCAVAYGRVRLPDP